MHRSAGQASLPDAGHSFVFLLAPHPVCSLERSSCLYTLGLEILWGLHQRCKCAYYKRRGTRKALSAAQHVLHLPCWVLQLSRPTAAHYRPTPLYVAEVDILGDDLFAGSIPGWACLQGLSALKLLHALRAMRTTGLRRVRNASGDGGLRSEGGIGVDGENDVE